jgi:hypothetical protein
MSDETATLAIEPLEHGRWRLAVDGTILIASGLVRDRAILRATLDASQGEVSYGAHINLTSELSRARFVRAAHQAGVTVPTVALQALDQGLRQAGVGRRPGPTEQRSTGGGEFSGEVPGTVAGLTKSLKEYVLLADPRTLEIPLAALAAHRLPGDPVWLLMVAPPASLKTEIIALLSAVAGAFPLSELTSKTFASGLTIPGQDDPSLLGRLTNEILLLKDFTSVLEMRWEERQAILAQLREIFDGRFDKVWGTGKELHWRGRLGFLAGVTPVIDHHHSVMALLGARFILFRPGQPNRQEAAVRAIANSGRGDEGKTRQHLAGLVGAFMAALPPLVPTLTETDHQTLATLADYITRARSGVERDGYRRELEYAPAPEMPARFGRQLASLARGLALVRHQATVTEVELKDVTRVALDSIPAVRRVVLKALLEHEGDLSTTTLRQQVQFGTTTVTRALEDLQSLELVTCDGQGKGRPNRWSLHAEWRSLVETFSGADPEPAPPRTDADEAETERF